MSACPACGSQGSPASVPAVGFFVLACDGCGLALGLSLKASNPVARSKPPRPTATMDTTETGAYRLTPTGPHSVFSESVSGPAGSPVRHPESTVRQSGRLMAVLNSDELFEAAKQAAKGSDVIKDLTGHEDGCALLTAYAEAIQANEKPNILLLEASVRPIPVAELARAIRALESGLGAKRTPMLILGDGEHDEELNVICRSLGNARFIRRPENAGADDLGGRMMTLVEKLLVRH